MPKNGLWRSYKLLLHPSQTQKSTVGNDNQPCDILKALSIIYYLRDFWQSVFWHPDTKNTKNRKIEKLHSVGAEYNF